MNFGKKITLLSVACLSFFLLTTRPVLATVELLWNGVMNVDNFTGANCTPGPTSCVLSNWNSWGTTQWQSDTYVYKSSPRSIKFSGGDQNSPHIGGYYQIIDVTPGAFYTVSGWTRRYGSNGSNFIGVRFGSSGAISWYQLYDTATYPGTSGVMYSFSINVQADSSITMTVYMAGGTNTISKGGQNDVYFDDLSVVKTADAPVCDTCGDGGNACITTACGSGVTGTCNKTSLSTGGSCTTVTGTSCTTDRYCTPVALAAPTVSPLTCVNSSTYKVNISWPNTDVGGVYIGEYLLRNSSGIYESIMDKFFDPGTTSIADAVDGFSLYSYSGYSLFNLTAGRYYDARTYRSGSFSGSTVFRRSLCPCTAADTVTPGVSCTRTSGTGAAGDSCSTTSGTRTDTYTGTTCATATAVVNCQVACTSPNTCVSGVCAAVPAISSLQIGNNSNRVADFTSTLNASGLQSTQGGKGWYNPMTITLNATRGTGTLIGYYVAFYDKSLTQLATTEAFISTIKSNFNSDIKAKNGFLLGYNAATARYFVWDYSITINTDIATRTDLGAVDCDTNGCFVEIAGEYLNICGKNTSGNKDCTNKLYYTVTPVSAASWKVALDKNFGSKTMYTASYVTDSNNLSGFNANIDPVYP